MRRILFLLALAIPIVAELTYQKPPQEVLDILNAPAPPVLGVNPSRTYATLSQSERYPSIAEVSEPMLRLAGLRINPRTNGLHLAPASFSVTLVKLPEGTKIPLSLPARARAGQFALVAGRKAVRLCEHHRGRYRFMARRSCQRQDQKDRRYPTQRRAGRPYRVAARQSHAAGEGGTSRPRSSTL